MRRDFGTSLLLCSSRFFASLILLRKFELIVTGRREKKIDKVYIFSLNNDV